MIKHYKKQIQNINPVEQGFMFKSKNWDFDTSLLSRIASDGDIITRKMIVEKFEHYYKNNQNTDFRIPFLCTMIWGFGNAGYGSFRTKKYLEEENTDKIKAALDFMDKNQVEKAFHKLMSISGLGISFTSKVLHFAGKAKGENYPLIFDIRVANALVMLLDKKIASMLAVMPVQKWETYNAYNEMLHQWAKEHSVEADQIELFLFNQAM